MGTLYPKLIGHLSTSTSFSGDIKIISFNQFLIYYWKLLKIIKYTDFVSTIMNETTDIMTKFQLSTTLWYMTNEGVEERFLTFVYQSWSFIYHLAKYVFHGEKWDSESLSYTGGFFQTIQDFDI